MLGKPAFNQFKKEFPNDYSNYIDLHAYYGDDVLFESLFYNVGLEYETQSLVILKQLGEGLEMVNNNVVWLKLALGDRKKFSKTRLDWNVYYAKSFYSTSDYSIGDRENLSGSKFGFWLKFLFKEKYYLKTQFYQASMQADGTNDFDFKSQLSLLEIGLETR
jgi:hypothetical protein